MCVLRAGMVMRWGELQTGGVIKYPGFLYRQLLTRSQMEGGSEGGHHSGIANIIRDKCLHEEKAGGEAEPQAGGCHSRAVN